MDKGLFVILADPRLWYQGVAPVYNDNELHEVEVRGAFVMVTSVLSNFRNTFMTVGIAGWYLVHLEISEMP